MHERYYYPADVLVVLLALARPGQLFAMVPLVVVGTSLVSYFPYLFHAPVALFWLSFGMGAIVLVLMAVVVTDARRSER